ncbi:SGNH/GDSL hydrolase family protein [Arthrobacter sp. ZGTC412]|uniref:SGNH/GDSL hydrolase family protein n=1 Tax=Arthrobacter sp. ZGTC412 TaxID=2058900 RepID=UPI0015E3E100|nr:SGNH/GDSL hydrolase family protein [Arthrobacter sp. ZGTC412]
MGTAKARRRHSAVGAGLAALAMAAGLAVAPVYAAEKTKYIALGDSFAAGQGAGPYLDGCYRSENAYSELADEAKAIHLVTNAACSGRTTRDVMNDQLRKLNKSTELVTITAGGNNIGFGDIINYCGVALLGDTPGTACGTATAYATTQIQSGQLYSDLLSKIRSVQTAAPTAKIVVTGYPYLLDPIPAGRTDTAAVFIYQATQLSDLLNGTIAAAATAADKATSGDPKVQYVDVRAAFAGHGALSGDPWINLGTASDAFHPNARGYRAYFTALNQAGAYAVR